MRLSHDPRATIPNIDVAEVEWIERLGLVDLLNDFLQLRHVRPEATSSVSESTKPPKTTLAKATGTDEVGTVFEKAGASDVLDYPPGPPITTTISIATVIASSTPDTSAPITDGPAPTPTTTDGTGSVPTGGCFTACDPITTGSSLVIITTQVPPAQPGGGAFPSDGPITTVIPPIISPPVPSAQPQAPQAPPDPEGDVGDEDGNEVDGGGGAVPTAATTIRFIASDLLITTTRVSDATITGDDGRLIITAVPFTTQVMTPPRSTGESTESATLIPTGSAEAAASSPRNVPLIASLTSVSIALLAGVSLIFFLIRRRRRRERLQDEDLTSEMASKFDADRSRVMHASMDDPFAAHPRLPPITVEVSMSTTRAVDWSNYPSPPSPQSAATDPFSDAPLPSESDSVVYVNYEGSADDDSPQSQRSSASSFGMLYQYSAESVARYLV